MSITKLQDSPVVVGTPVEIEYAVNEIRKVLATLTWISHPYFIAQRFFRIKGRQRFYYPETYAPEGIGDRNYHRLTPDNDYTGMLFFIVGKNKIDWERNSENFLTYKVGVIFSVNLSLIDNAKLDNGLFTQELIKEARRLLSRTVNNHSFEYKIESETRDKKEVYREFSLGEDEQYNRAPMQCFRFDMTITVEEDCDDSEGITSSPFIPSVSATGNITVLNTGENLPENVDGNTSFLILNVGSMTQNLNISDYTPTGLIKGATVRFRKMDDSEFKIKYAVGEIDYSFVDLPTEYIDLLWDGSKLIV